MEVGKPVKRANGERSSEPGGSSCLQVMKCRRFRGNFQCISHWDHRMPLHATPRALMHSYGSTSNIFCNHRTMPSAQPTAPAACLARHSAAAPRVTIRRSARRSVVKCTGEGDRVLIGFFRAASRRNSREDHWDPRAAEKSGRNFIHRPRWIRRIGSKQFDHPQRNPRCG